MNAQKEYEAVGNHCETIVSGLFVFFTFRGHDWKIEVVFTQFNEFNQ